MFIPECSMLFQSVYTISFIVSCLSSLNELLNNINQRTNNTCRVVGVKLKIKYFYGFILLCTFSGVHHCSHTLKPASIIVILLLLLISDTHKKNFD